MALYPAIDFLAGITAFNAWRTRSAAWKLHLAGLYLLQLLGHAAFWSAINFRGPGIDQNSYLWWNNSVYALQLLVVGWQGARDGVLAGGARAWMRNSFRSRPHPGG